MSADATKYAGSVDNVFIYITVVSIILLLGVTFSMIYFVIRYNRKRNPKASQIEGNVFLEVIWVAVPTLLALSMFYYGFTEFSHFRRIPKDSYEIKVTGRMWQWNFEYPNGKKFDTLYVPIGRPVKLTLNSVDVVHSFYIPAFRIKEDVVPGRTDYLGFTAEKQGSYVVECAEYCGMKHSYMLNKVVVLSQPDFDRWVKKGASGGGSDSTKAGTPAKTGSRDNEVLKNKNQSPLNLKDSSQNVK